MTINHHFAPLTDLLGELVQDVAGLRVGRLADLVLDEADGSVAYALVARHDDAGAKLLPIPWRSLVIDRSRRAVLLHIACVHLDAAPGLDETSARALAPAALDAYVRAHYGETPYW